MSNWIEQLIWGGETNPKLPMTADVHHVELTDEHLVVGLQLEWRNQLDHPISVKEIGARIYLDRWNQKPLWLYPLERFSRIPPKKWLDKAPMGPFTLPSKERYAEQIRFISQEVVDLQPGRYTVDVDILDDDNVTYTGRASIQLEAKDKYRHSAEWVSF